MPHQPTGGNEMNMPLKNAVRLIVFSALVAVTVSVSAQQYPSKPIHIVVGVTPGGSTDALAREVANSLKRLGQPVSVENRPGAGSIIANSYVAKAAPDGHTLLFHTNSFHIEAASTKDLPFDPIKDFIPIGTFGSTPFVMLVHPSVPVTTLKEFIAYLKTHKNLNFGSSSPTSSSRLAGEVFKVQANVYMRNISYKGAGAMMPDFLAGRVQMSFNTPTVSIPLVNAGKVRPLAIVGESRLATLPDVPTFAEAGMPEFDEKAWFGVTGPAGIPRQAIEVVSGELASLQRDAGILAMFKKRGIEPLILSPEQTADLSKKELTKLVQLFKTVKLD
jgi:tripartite-type tricarboxylate transporter receptor subunit TctC